MRAIAAATFVLGIAGLNGCVVATSSNTNGSSGGSFIFILLPLVLVMAAFVMARGGRSRRRSRRSARDDGVFDRVNPQLIRAELSVLADDVLRLELNHPGIVGGSRPWKRGWSHAT